MQPPEIEIVFKEIFASNLCCADRRTAMMLSGLWKANGTLKDSEIGALERMRDRASHSSTETKFRIARPEERVNA